ncbi:MAG: alpha/beta fold hydrolase [Rhizobium sp.]|nr:alpha/beta fold hydrolase [Rhizobium sp.]
MFRLANKLAAAGLPTLRFDYPGTADAIGAPVVGVRSWVASVDDAADRLKATCGLDRIMLVGLGIGATMALLASARRDDVEGLILAAPVVSGRRYLRETALGASAVEEGLGLHAAQRPEGVSIGGIVMPSGVAADLKAIDLVRADLGHCKPVLLVHRPSHPQETEFADHLESQGWPVERAVFDGYQAAMDNPTISVMPEGVIDTISGWALGMAEALPLLQTKPVPTTPVLVDSGHGVEEALCFGEGLFGIVTQPAIRTATPIVVFLNSGYDHHAGWAYQWVRTAQTLAEEGVGSLRFDMANIGDSGPRPGAAAQVLYSTGQQQDIATAIDMLADRGEHTIIVVGRCSGAFAALHAAARDDRIKGAVVINPLRLVWDQDEDVEVAIRVGPRSIADYRQRALSGKTLRRLLAGEIDIPGVARGLGTQFIRRITQRLAPLVGSLSKSTRLRRECAAMMGEISGRGAALHFVCSERDASLEQVAFQFGGDFGGLGRYPDASLTTVPDADHNMTPQHAHDAVLEVIRDSIHRVEAATGPDTVFPAGSSGPQRLRA